MRTFMICFEVPQSKLATIIELLSGEVNALKVEQVTARKAPEVPPKRSINRESLVEKAITSWLKEADFKTGGEFSFAEAQAAVKAAGFNPTSTSPVLSKLRAAKMIETIGKGVYRIL